MKPLPMIAGGEPKFLFVSPDSTEAVVVTMGDVIESGTPLVCEGEHEGDDMEYAGQVAPSVPVGQIDLSEYVLPEAPRPTA